MLAWPPPPSPPCDENIISLFLVWLWLSLNIFTLDVLFGAKGNAKGSSYKATFLNNHKNMCNTLFLDTCVFHARSHHTFGCDDLMPLCHFVFVCRAEPRTPRISHVICIFLWVRNAVTFIRASPAHWISFEVGHHLFSEHWYSSCSPQSVPTSNFVNLTKAQWDSPSPSHHKHQPKWEKVRRWKEAKILPTFQPHMVQARTWFPSNEMQKSPNLTNEPLC